LFGVFLATPFSTFLAVQEIEDPFRHRVFSLGLSFVIGSFFFDYLSPAL